jgi:Collagen triple helix repeat (20 copies)
MTVQTTHNFVEYIGDGITQVFLFDFVTFDIPSVTGYVDELEEPSEVTLNSDQANSPGGTLTFDVPPPLDSAIQIERIVALTQLSIYDPYGPFPAQTSEQNWDRAVLMVQQQQAFAEGAEAEADRAALEADRAEAAADVLENMEAEATSGVPGSNAEADWDNGTGTMSFTIPRGDQGDQGNQGSQGIDGDQGIQGDQGDQGVQGIQGEVGDQGDPGPGVDFKGIDTLANILLKPVVQGDLWTSSTAGTLPPGHPSQPNQPVAINDGLIGNGTLMVWEWTGPVQGPQGEDGEQGVQGEQGIQGTQGIQGVQGPDGIDGADGAQIIHHASEALAIAASVGDTVNIHVWDAV